MGFFILFIQTVFYGFRAYRILFAFCTALVHRVRERFDHSIVFDSKQCSRSSLGCRVNRFFDISIETMVKNDVNFRTLVFQSYCQTAKLI